MCLGAYQRPGNAKQPEWPQSDERRAQQMLQKATTTIVKRIKKEVCAAGEMKLFFCLVKLGGSQYKMPF